MALLDEDNGINRRGTGVRGKTPEYAKMPRAGRVIIDPAKLRYYRHVRMMTRADLAALVRTHVDSIQKYELGIRYPRESAFRRLCTALGIEPEQLLFDDCRYIRKGKEDEDAGDLHGEHRGREGEEDSGTRTQA